MFGTRGLLSAEPAQCESKLIAIVRDVLCLPDLSRAAPCALAVQGARSTRKLFLHKTCLKLSIYILEYDLIETVVNKNLHFTKKFAFYNFLARLCEYVTKTKVS